MAKRSNGEGSTYFVPKETGPTWGRRAPGEPKERGFYSGYVTTPDGRKYRSAPTLKGVQAKLQVIKDAMSQGLPVGDGDRLGPFLTWWLTTQEARATSKERSVNTVDNSAWAVNHWIIPSVGSSKRLRELEAEDVEKLLAKMVEEGLGREAVKRVKSVLGQALAVAQRRGKIARNVARIAETPATPTPTPRRALNIDEVKLAMAAAKGELDVRISKRWGTPMKPEPERLEALFVTAMMLGMRPGELTGLLEESLDLEGETMRVERSLKHERGKLRLGDTKTDGSKRPLTLPAPVVVALKAHRTRQRAERLAAPVWEPDCTDPRCAERNHGGCRLVFTNEVGRPIDPAGLRRVTKRLCLKAGVEPVSPNELGRHTAATLLWEAGVSLERIAELLGHGSIRMLEQHYRERGRKPIATAVGPMEDMFGA